MLRDADDTALTSLLLDRPDLAFPELVDFSQIASRATTRQSVAAALDLLDAFDLWVAHRLAVLPVPVSAAAVAEAGADLAAVGQAMDRLRSLALAWGDTDTLRPVRVLGGVLGESAPGPPPDPVPPRIAVAEQLKPGLVDKVAAGSAFEFVRRMDVLVEHCDHQPLRRRRDGALTSRQVRGMAELLDVPTAVATTYVTLAEAAGLLGLTAHRADEVMIPTREYDVWQAAPLRDQWAMLVSTWIGDARVGAPGWLIKLCLDGLGTPGAGEVVDEGDLRAWIEWHRPRRPANTDRLVGMVLEQATMLGVTGLGAPASFGPSADAAGIDALLPERVDHVLIQADLTAVAPGPLTVDAGRDLAALADVESRGGATVYRFSAESLRRAGDLGWGAEEILQTLTARSRTPIPQPLAYLVRDVDRPPADSEPSPRRVAHLPPVRALPRLTADDLTAWDRLDSDAAAGAVATLRRTDAADDAVEPPDRRVTNTGPYIGPLAVLREAVETGEPVWFGYVDRTGERAERLVTAQAVDDGVLLAEDVKSQDSVRLPVHRITAAHIIRTAS